MNDYADEQTSVGKDAADDAMACGFFDRLDSPATRSDVNQVIRRFQRNTLRTHERRIVALEEGYLAMKKVLEGVQPKIEDVHNVVLDPEHGYEATRRAVMRSSRWIAVAILCTFAVSALPNGMTSEFAAIVAKHILKL